MEAIRISCAGFPTRKTFDEFVTRFNILAPEVLCGRLITWFLLYAIIILYNSFSVFLVVFAF